MRQRNDTGYTQHVSAWPDDEHPDRRPFDVAAGEECEFPEPLAGFTPVGGAAPEPAEAPKPRKTAAAQAAPEGGEPR